MANMLKSHAKENFLKKWHFKHAINTMSQLCNYYCNTAKQTTHNH